MKIKTLVLSFLISGCWPNFMDSIPCNNDSHCPNGYQCGSGSICVEKGTKLQEAGSVNMDSGSILQDAVSSDMDSGSIEAAIIIASTKLKDDSNGDGYLNPGESAKVEVYAKNTGTSKALKLWTSLTSQSSYVTLSVSFSCIARASGGGSSPCSSACSCGGVADYAKPDLEPGQTTSDPILTIPFNLDAGAPLQPIEFELTFNDSMGNSWKDSFQIGVKQ